MGGEDLGLRVVRWEEGQQTAASVDHVILLSPTFWYHVVLFVRRKIGLNVQKASKVGHAWYRHSYILVYSYLCRGVLHAILENNEPHQPHQGKRVDMSVEIMKRQ